MNVKQIVAKDTEDILNCFPKLRAISSVGRPPCYQGEIDICDSKGVFWDTFQVRIIAPAAYPFGVPVLQETGRRIERIPDRHISPYGHCCVAIDHLLLYHAVKGLTINDFVREYVYPYLANHLYFESTGKYANEEYHHGFEGIQQFYSETLNCEEANTVVNLIERVLSKNLPSRNGRCFCGGSKKFKRCHLFAIEFLSMLDTERLNKDLSQFKKSKRVIV